MIPLRRNAFLLAMALLGAPATALAQRCDRGRAGVPLAVALGPGPTDFGTTPVPCGDPRVALDGRLSALIDEPDFYGALGVAGVLSATVPVSRHVWLSGAITAVRYRYVQNATLLGTDLGLGPTDLGVHVGVMNRDHLRASVYLRALLPTEFPTEHALRTGAEFGAATLYTRGRWSVLGGLSFPIEVNVIGSRARTDFAFRASVDASVLVGAWFEPSLGVELRLGADDAGELEYIAPRVALRAHLGRRVMLHLSGMLPLGGLERTNAWASLGLALGL